MTFFIIINLTYLTCPSQGPLLSLGRLVLPGQDHLVLSLVQDKLFLDLDARGVLDSQESFFVQVDLCTFHFLTHWDITIFPHNIVSTVTPLFVPFIGWVSTSFLPNSLQLFTVRVSTCLLYTSPSPRDGLLSRMPSSA